jgi:hypothetical protein
VICGNEEALSPPCPEPFAEIARGDRRAQPGTAWIGRPGRRLRRGRPGQRPGGTGSRRSPGGNGCSRAKARKYPDAIPDPGPPPYVGHITRRSGGPGSYRHPADAATDRRLRARLSKGPSRYRQPSGRRSPEHAAGRPDKYFVHRRPVRECLLTPLCGFRDFGLFLVTTMLDAGSSARRPARPAGPACIALTGLNVQRSFRNER